MIIKMFTEISWIDKPRENFKKELKYISKNQSELKNTITEMKNTLEGINNRLDDTEWIGDLEDRIVKILWSEKQKHKKLNKWDSLRKFWDNIKCTKIPMISVPEGEKRENGVEKLFLKLMI